MPLRPTAQILLPIGFVLVVALAITIIKLPVGAATTTDFIQYWSAWQLLLDGKNPYDGEVMRAFQLAMNPNNSGTIMMWNPPWTVALIAPILALPFEKAIVAWLILQLFLLSAIAIMAPQALDKAPTRPIISGLATIFFYPILECLALGQLSIVLAFAVVAFLWSVREKRYLLAGLSIVPLTFKPHLFFLCIIPGVVWFGQCSCRARRQITAGTVVGFVALLGISAIVAPHAIWWWLESIRTSPGVRGVTPVWEWQTATIASAIRSLLPSSTPIPPLWPLWMVPLASWGGCTFYFFLHRSRPIVWSEVMPALMCLSLATSWYGWLFDQSLLVICQLSIVYSALAAPSGRTRYALLGSLVLIQAVAVVVGIPEGSAQHHYTWLPLALLTTLGFSTWATTQQRTDMTCTGP